MEKELENDQRRKDKDLYLDDGNNMLLQEYLKNTLLIDNSMLDASVDVTLEVGQFPRTMNRRD
eukprot:2729121-Rhodomonas_salina.1